MKLLMFAIVAMFASTTFASVQCKIVESIVSAGEVVRQTSDIELTSFDSKEAKGTLSPSTSYSVNTSSGFTTVSITEGDPVLRDSANGSAEGRVRVQKLKPYASMTIDCQVK